MCIYVRRSFWWPSPNLKWDFSLFICMPRSQPTCIICNKRINTKLEERPISYIKDDAIYQVLHSKNNASSLRVHIPCGLRPQKHGWNKVSTWKFHEHVKHMLNGTKPATRTVAMSREIYMCLPSNRVENGQLLNIKCVYMLMYFRNEHCYKKMFRMMI